jgi:hypothetical protein
MPNLNRLLALSEFAFHSLAQAYGHYFLRRIVLRHPLHAARGFLAYARTTETPDLWYRLGGGREEEFAHRAAVDGERFLVATGFCQKPLPATVHTNRGSTGRDNARVRSNSGCPAGRFNHQCLYLSRLDLATQERNFMPPACAGCTIRALGQASLEAGASFAILTSALDIADDILLPSVQQGRFARFVFAVCPYSIEPMRLALSVCGLEGYLIGYQSGSCVNYRQWLRADQGDKAERTTLSTPDLSRLLQLLGSVAAARRSPAGERPTRYRQVRHVFEPW